MAMTTREIVESFDRLGMRAEVTSRGIEVYESPEAQKWTTVLLPPSDEHPHWCWKTLITLKDGEPQWYQWAGVNAGGSNLVDMVVISIKGTEWLENHVATE